MSIWLRPMVKWPDRTSLEELARGLAKEMAVIRTAEDPLLYLERRVYLCAVADAHAGVDAARVVLAQALQRLGASD